MAVPVPSYVSETWTLNKGDWNIIPHELSNVALGQKSI